MLVITFDDSEEEAIHKICDLFEPEHVERIVPLNQKIEVFGEIKIDSRERIVSYNDKEVSLNHLEFDTFAFLAGYPNWIFTKEQIYEAVWEEAGENCGSAVANVISQIRRKLRQAGVEQEYIQTVINQGYKFVAERRAEADR